MGLCREHPLETGQELRKGINTNSSFFFFFKFFIIALLGAVWEERRNVAVGVGSWVEYSPRLLAAILRFLFHV